MSEFGVKGIIHRGGGANGAFGAGVIYGLAKAGFFDKDFRYSYGVSVGVLNLASLIIGLSKEMDCNNAADAMMERWLALAADKRGDAALFQPIFLGKVRSQSSIYTDRGLKELICGIDNKNGKFIGLDAKTLVESPIKFEFGVHQEVGRRRIYEIISNHQGDIRDDPAKILLFLQASASIAPFFPPVRIGDNIYSDGLYPKFKPAFEFGCQTIILIINDHAVYADDKEIMDWHERAALPYDDCNDRVVEFALRYIRDDLNRGKIIQISAMGSGVPFLDKAVNIAKPVILRDDDGKLLPRIIVIAPTKYINGLGATKYTKAGIECGLKHGIDRANEVLAALK